MLEADLKFTRGRLPIDVRLRLPHLNAGILAPSGSGKSCLLRMLAGELQPDAGYIALDGMVLFDSRRHINRLRNNAGIIWVSEEQTLDTDKTVRENLLSLDKGVAAGRNSLDFATVAACLELEDRWIFAHRTYRKVKNNAFCSAARCWPHPACCCWTMRYRRSIAIPKRKSSRCCAMRNKNSA